MKTERLRAAAAIADELAAHLVRAVARDLAVRRVALARHASLLATLALHKQVETAACEWQEQENMQADNVRGSCADARQTDRPTTTPVHYLAARQLEAAAGALHERRLLARLDGIARHGRLRVVRRDDRLLLARLPAQALDNAV